MVISLQSLLCLFGILVQCHDNQFAISYLLIPLEFAGEVVVASNSSRWNPAVLSDGKPSVEISVPLPLRALVIAQALERIV
ncbi:MAG: hypothetical protein GY878_22540 [Fuerstiella sp.]|nr:hypothetical protein [Fuerstiella sp.]